MLCFERCSLHVLVVLTFNEFHFLIFNFENSFLKTKCRRINSGASWLINELVLILIDSGCFGAKLPLSMLKPVLVISIAFREPFSRGAGDRSHSSVSGGCSSSVCL